MIRFLAVLALAVLVTPVSAQETGSLLASRRIPVSFEAIGSYQSFDASGGTVNQIAVPVSIGIPLGRTARARVVAGQASVSGDGLEDLSGMSNVQVGLAKAIRLGRRATAQVGGNVGLPTGTTGLTSEQFATAVLVSRVQYRFRQPGFGQGLSFHPHAVLALEVADHLVLGLGVTFGYRDAFDPTDAITDYEPGEEILVTAGVNYALDNTSSLSLDVSLTNYSADQLGGETVLEAGQRSAILVQYLRRSGLNEARLWGRYRTQATSLLRGIESPAATPPSIAEAGLSAAFATPGPLRLGASASVMSLSEIECAVDGEICQEAETLVRVLLEPQLRLSASLSLVARGGALLGTTQGWEGGFGLRARL